MTEFHIPELRVLTSNLYSHIACTPISIQKTAIRKGLKPDRQSSQQSQVGQISAVRSVRFLIRPSGSGLSSLIRPRTDMLTSPMGRKRPFPIHCLCTHYIKCNDPGRHPGTVARVEWAVVQNPSNPIHLMQPLYLHTFLTFMLKLTPDTI